MVFSILFRLASTYSKVIVLPVSGLIGFIGYKIEGFLSDGYTPSLKSIKEIRDERLLNDEEEVKSIKEMAKSGPKAVLEKNLSPSLEKPDPRLKKYSEK